MNPDDDGQLLRYARHLLLPEFDAHGQQRLGAAKVLIIGMGGLGCPAAQYLSTAGVGSLTLCDPDTVSLSNLPRQILYTDADLHHPKVAVAARKLQQLNPAVHIVCAQQAADGAFLEASVPKVDLVLDCSDNFLTRHAVNRACRAAKKTLISAAAIGWSGQLAVFPPQGPCYACLYPETGEETWEDRCAVSGVMAPLVGIMGTLQALEAIRLLLGIPSPLAGKVLLVDGHDLQFRSIALQKDPQCPVCA
ncbi:MAG: HesA/MoeB/ThiF family protein [Acidithiobacillus sp.]|nr:HesA/MoeB/ThiF family protein [Acidithiobacillus sp.]